MKGEALKLEPRVRNVDRRVAEKAVEYRSTIQTPEGGRLALADAIILAAKF